ncbi:hypothetical protein [Cereibacter sphaeroides]|uniref:hypothetical protein n=1 Tax=Cereibacter sphaeroides TaxID=1063 RepID=UPI0015F9E5CC|nr:hypothetical protein [Cereibacter sphaeroides]
MSTVRGIPFEAAGTVRTLAFTTAAMVRYQRAAGETLIAGVLAVEREGFDAERVGRIVDAGLGGKLTEEEVFALIDAVGYTEAIRLIGRAFEEAFPVPEPKADPDAEAEPAGNGAGVSETTPTP